MGRVASWDGRWRTILLKVTVEQNDAFISRLHVTLHDQGMSPLEYMV